MAENNKRKIWFRGWIEKSKKFVYGNYYEDDTYGDYICGITDDIKVNAIDQYINKDDAEGEMIYENDIVMIEEAYRNMKRTWYGVVTYDTSLASFVISVKFLGKMHFKHFDDARKEIKNGKEVIVRYKYHKIGDKYNNPKEYNKLI